MLGWLLTQLRILLRLASAPNVDAALRSERIWPQAREGVFRRALKNSDRSHWERCLEQAGRIDRMVVAKDRVLVVDYKSDAVPAGTVSEIPASYLTQVGLYAHVASQLFPELGVQAGILWTSLESLMIIPPAALRDAVSAFTMR